MMRTKPSASMQKCYDDAYLQCSTAVYFEGQNNEAEALRSWRQALDTIYYHNAYRIPANYRPKTEVERALQESLRQMELQCKERVDLLEALKQSREEATKEKDTGKREEAPKNIFQPPVRPTSSNGAAQNMQNMNEWLGGGTVPPMSIPDISHPPPLPIRPNLLSKTSSSSVTTRSQSLPQPDLSATLAPLSPMSSMPQPYTSRTPSPDKKQKGMLKTLRPGMRDKESRNSSRMADRIKTRPPAAANAATLAWSSRTSSANTVYMQTSGSSANISASRDRLPTSAAAASLMQDRSRATRPERSPRTRSSRDTRVSMDEARSGPASARPSRELPRHTPSPPEEDDALDQSPPTPPIHREGAKSLPVRGKSPLRLPKLDPDVLSYRKEYPAKPVVPDKIPAARAPARASQLSTQASPNSTAVRRKVVPGASSYEWNDPLNTSSDTGDDVFSNHRDTRPSRQRRQPKESEPKELPVTPDETASEEDEDVLKDRAWKARCDRILKHLLKGVDEAAAKQILNEIVIHGDEVHWEDVAGLEVAKSALKETVVYPFLRPDLFMGLREPARGMLLFGPPGTGKTMLARAVATESKSTFFAISASSLTSKYLGESEKLVRALFVLAKALAPSIIFVDEIDSLLSSRSGSGEHEATRRIKTEFLIQWSDLAKAAAGRETSEKEKEKGDATRVLVLAATNLPWAIDEAARRRFVRRQYIPLPEDHVRKQQLQTLLSHQKHSLNDEDLDHLVELTDGFSGSDITALAKDAAMGPLRSLGEKLLMMSMDDIRPIGIEDFEASLVNIRPSVSKQGLKEFEDWAREFGERGG